MKFLIIDSHPYEKSFNRSLTKGISETLVSKHEVDTINLIEDGFDPVMNSEDLKVFADGKSVDPKVLIYQEKIKNADVLIFSFPIWWGSMPAILKGFFDKVFLKDFAYVYGKYGMLKGLLNKEAYVITTMETPKVIYNLFLHNPIQNQFISGTLGMSGIKTKKYFQIDKINTKTDEERKETFDSILKYFSKM